MSKSALPVWWEKWFVAFVVGCVGSDSFLVISKKSFGMTKPAPPVWWEKWFVVAFVVGRVGSDSFFGRFKKGIRND